MQTYSMKKFCLMIVILCLASCTGVPKGVEPVKPFVLASYLGTWYEIARLDHSFERGLSDVTAQYSLRADGGVQVINRGFNAEESKWQEAQGKAYFVDSTDVGRLKVSFFGPFYGAYNIARLAPDYSMALVVGPDLSYGWILSRTATPDLALLTSFKKTASDLGISTTSWIMVTQSNHEKP
jgi:apolipoprotein D and lipocalin family protein